MLMRQKDRLINNDSLNGPYTLILLNLARGTGVDDLKILEAD